MIGGAAGATLSTVMESPTAPLDDDEAAAMAEVLAPIFCKKLTRKGELDSCSELARYEVVCFVRFTCGLGDDEGDAEEVFPSA